MRRSTFEFCLGGQRSSKGNRMKNLPVGPYPHHRMLHRCTGQVRKFSKLGKVYSRNVSCKQKYRESAVPSQSKLYISAPFRSQRSPFLPSGGWCRPAPPHAAPLHRTGTELFSQPGEVYFSTRQKLQGTSCVANREIQGISCVVNGKTSVRFR